MTPPPAAERARRRELPGKPASAVYGTIVAAGQLAIESGTANSAAVIIASLAATLAVFWVAHAYTDTLGAAIDARGDHPPSLRRALRVEWPIIESGAAPAAVLAVVAAAGVRTSTAAVIALVVAVAELIGWAVLAGRRAGATGWRLVLYSGLAGALGGVLIVLKYVLH